MSMKPHEFSGVYFHLKGRSWPGPTKLSWALPAERSHRAACLQQYWLPISLYAIGSEFIGNYVENNFVGPAIFWNH